MLQRTVDAIVHEARRPVRTDLAADCDVVEVVRSRCHFWLALAEDQRRSMSVVLPEGPVLVPVAGDDLVDLVDVLIDNVFAHTPEGTDFGVTLEVGAATVVLRVEDAGPGLTAGPPGPRPGSTGLGLDIARRTATGAGGELVVGAGPSGGTRVEATLPRTST